MNFTQDKIDEIKDKSKNQCCSICKMPANSNHTLDKVYLDEAGNILAVINNKCKEYFYSAYYLTLSVFDYQE